VRTLAEMGLRQPAIQLTSAIANAPACSAHGLRRAASPSAENSRLLSRANAGGLERALQVRDLIRLGDEVPPSAAGRQGTGQLLRFSLLLTVSCVAARKIVRPAKVGVPTQARGPHLKAGVVSYLQRSAALDRPAQIDILFICAEAELTNDPGLLRAGLRPLGDGF
jgi:hypothetical protein